MRRIPLFMLISLLIISTFLAAFKLPIPEVKAEEPVIFSDDFESYSVGLFPPSPWEWWFDGAGSSSNKIVNSMSHSGTKSFTMLGEPGWASVSAASLPRVTDMIGYEVWVRAENYGSGTGAWMGFNFIRYDAIWGGFCGVAFIGDGSIVGGPTVLQHYDLNTWYKVRVIFDMNTRKYSIWINDVLKGADILDTNPEDPKTTLRYFGLASDHGQQQCYFDDVRVFEAKASHSKTVEEALTSLNSLRDGVLDGADIVDSQAMGSSVEFAKTAVGLVTELLPSTKFKIFDEALGLFVDITAGELLDKVKGLVDINTLRQAYSTGGFTATIEEHAKDVIELDSTFQRHEDVDLAGVEFVSDMQHYHQFVSDLGCGFSNDLSDIVDAHEWTKFNRDLIFMAGGLMIVIITWGSSAVFVLAAKCTYNTVTGISNIRDEADFYRSLVIDSMLQEAEALYHAQRVAEGLRYLANKLASSDVAFPKLSFSPIQGGGAWINNEYDKPIQVKLVHSVSLACSEIQTIEPLTRYYEVPYGEYVIAPGSSMMFLPPNPPQDVVRWEEHLESFGYTIAKSSWLNVFYGEDGFDAMKTIPLPISGGEAISIVAKSPVNLLVTAPNGLRVGYDSEIGSAINEIEGAKYSGSGTEPQVITVSSPLQGVYIIDLFGTGTGSYMITVESVAEDGTAVDTETWTGTTSPEKHEVSSFVLAQDGSVRGYPGFVIPDLPMGTIAALTSMIIALATYFSLPKWRKLRRK